MVLQKPKTWWWKVSSFSCAILKFLCYYFVRETWCWWWWWWQPPKSNLWWWQLQQLPNKKKNCMCLCLFVSSLSLAEIRTWWWLHLCGRRKPTYNMVLNYPYQQQLSFWLVPTSLKYRKSLLNFGGVIFLCVWVEEGLGLDMGLGSGGGVTPFSPLSPPPPIPTKRPVFDGYKKRASNARNWRLLKMRCPPTSGKDLLWFYLSFFLCVIGGHVTQHVLGVFQKLNVCWVFF